MPGATRERIVEATAFPVAFDPHCSTVPPPQPEVLDILRRRIDPLGLRRLEFVSARERGALIAEILQADRRMIELAITVQARRSAGSTVPDISACRDVRSPP
jgi:glutaconate CoA-transferase subunit A